MDICGPRLYGIVYLEYASADSIDVFLTCNHISNDRKNYISKFKNHEIFISRDSHYRYRKIKKYPIIIICGKGERFMWFKALF